MKKRAVFLAFLLLALFSTGVAQADILFSNFGPGDTFLTGAGVPVGVFGMTNLNEPAMGFTPSATAQLGSIDFVTSLISGTNEVHLSLVNDDQGVPLGSTLESWTFIDEMGTFNTATIPILTAGSITHPTLTAGTPYWLVASAPVSDTSAVWNFNPISDSGPRSFSTDGGSTWSASTDNIQSVFRVNSVPEPSTVLLLGAGLAGVGIMRRKFKK
jgi:hypothetical protein